MISVTHHRDDADVLADRVVKMREGKIEAASVTP
jgi:ABC-type Fe3+/spermidine/putrescine transport system ATPase subunit